jgi:hypothetical protein
MSGEIKARAKVSLFGTSVPKHRRQEHFGTGLVPQYKITPTTERKKEYTGIIVQTSKYQPTQLKQ